MDTIRREPRYAEDPEAMALASNVESVNCPNECSGDNGLCNNGELATGS